MGKKLYVGNMSYDVDSSALEQMVTPHGTVESAQVISDRDTGRSKGFGFVEMSSDSEAQAAIAAMNGNLDLNVMMPVIAHDLLESIELTAAAAHVFAEKCVRGIKANVERCREYAELTGQLVTAVAPVIGYDKAAAVYKKAVARNVSIRQIILEENLVPQAKLDEILDLRKLTRGGRA